MALSLAMPWQGEQCHGHSCILGVSKLLQSHFQTSACAGQAVKLEEWLVGDRSVAQCSRGNCSPAHCRAGKAIRAWSRGFCGAFLQGIPEPACTSLSKCSSKVGRSRLGPVNGIGRGPGEVEDLLQLCLCPEIV